MTREAIQRLPKTELHLHLDGSIRPSTMIELANEAGVELPHTGPDALARQMRADDSADLGEYLAKFSTTLSVMQTSYALERIAYELAIDNAAEGVRYVEVRYCPSLVTEGAVTLEEAIEAPLRGLTRAEEETGIITGIIVCGLRTFDPVTNVELADLAIAFQGRGVVAFDLAGAEHDHPPKKHREAFERIAANNMGITIHAGEAYGPESIHQAIHACGANRIGHGTRLFEDEELEAYVRDFRVPIEICLTSNVQTRAVPSYADHPLHRYFSRGLVVTLNTDNRLVSGTTVTDEYLYAHEHLGFTWEELLTVARMGFEAAFLPWPEKQRLLSEFDAVAATG